MTDFKLHHGDCLDVLRTMPDNSIDAIVTDPPYGLSDHKPAEVTACLSAWIAGEIYQPKGKGFMSTHWDAWVPGPEVWRECLRVLKPGGHMLAFAGTRSMDLMSMAIRLAGFELRDSIGHAHDGSEAPLLAWTFGSGFPKSLDVSKQIDKYRRRDYVQAAINLGMNIPGNSLHDWTKANHSPSDKWWDEFKSFLTPEQWGEIERSVIGNDNKGRAIFGSCDGAYDITAPATEAAKQWEGWGSALKPAWEPILLCRKPLTGTIAENVLEWGVGALNIDATRIPMNGEKISPRGSMDAQTDVHDGWARPWMGDKGKSDARMKAAQDRAEELGRWPANLITDGSQAVLDLFPSDKQGSAARYFYCAKASRSDRGEGNNHPTVKPLQLTQYLCRLITPPGGTILDPFTGSGSTGKAAMREGFRFVGIEREEEYLNIARARIEAAKKATNE